MSNDRKAAISWHMKANLLLIMHGYVMLCNQNLNSHNYYHDIIYPLMYLPIKSTCLVSRRAHVHVHTCTCAYLSNTNTNSLTMFIGGESASVDVQVGVNLYGSHT